MLRSEGSPLPRKPVCGISSRGRFKRSSCWPWSASARGRSCPSRRRSTSASTFRAAHASCFSSRRRKDVPQITPDVQNQVELVIERRVNSARRLRARHLESRFRPPARRGAGRQERRRSSRRCSKQVAVLEFKIVPPQVSQLARADKKYAESTGNPTGTAPTKTVRARRLQRLRTQERGPRLRPGRRAAGRFHDQGLDEVRAR